MDMLTTREMTSHADDCASEMIAPSASRIAERRTFQIMTSAGPIVYEASFPFTPRAETTPVIAIHGISRDAKAILDGFAEKAARRGRVVIAPKFDEGSWPVFQRPGSRVRPDIALLDMIEEARSLGLFAARRVTLFGFSGGAQLAHRFAMLYPHMIASLHLGAAGWYCLPDAKTAYPYGAGAARRCDGDWPRRIQGNLDRFLRLPINVYVGAEDNDPNATALRRNAALDAAQGCNRRARAAAYVASVNRAARGRTAADLIEMAGCGHSFEDCVRNGDLVDHVLDRSH